MYSSVHFRLERILNSFRRSQRINLLCPLSSSASSSAVRVSSLEKDGAGVAMKIALQSYRPTIFARINAEVKNFFSMARYRLSYDRRFRMRNFRSKIALLAVYVIAEKLARRDFASMKPIFVPSALTRLKKEIEEDKEMQKVVRVLNPILAPVLREKVRSSYFSYFPGLGTQHPVFEISLLYLCRLDSRGIDRSKKMTLLLPNRLGSYDQVPGTIPEDALVYVAVQITLIRSLKGTEQSDWLVSEYQAMPAFIRKKDLD